MKYPGVQRLIDVLRNVDDSADSGLGFDMGQWYDGRTSSRHACGSACCIAGWAEKELRRTGQLSDEVNADLSQVARVALLCDLRLSRAMQDTLWELTLATQLNEDKLTLPMAIKVLEIFRDTGEVKWLEVYLEMGGDKEDVDTGD